MATEDFFIRNIESDSLRENFLIAGVVSVFAVRLFLKLTNYPQLGGGDFHVAHILWGGFFMVAALIILMSFLSKSAANIAAVVGGIGFGMFIDEFGKFVTRDNDYFFQPTAAFIYIIFVLLYLISRVIPRYKAFSKREYLVNAIEMIKESAVNDFDVEEEKRAKFYLSKCDPQNPIVKDLTKLLSRIDAEPTPPPHLLTRMRQRLRRWYYTVAKSGLVLKLIITFLVVQTFLTILQVVSLFFVHPILPFSEWGKLYSSILAGIFVVIGVMALRFSKREAYRFFHISVLVSIFLTEFFAFMQSQWYELIGLSANLFMLVVITYVHAHEKQKNGKSLVKPVQV